MRTLLALALLAAPLAAQTSVTAGHALAPAGALRLVSRAASPAPAAWLRNAAS